jgi:hypothetical protein
MPKIRGAMRFHSSSGISQMVGKAFFFFIVHPLSAQNYMLSKGFEIVSKSIFVEVKGFNTDLSCGVLDTHPLTWRLRPPSPFCLGELISNAAANSH